MGLFDLEKINSMFDDFGFNKINEIVNTFHCDDYLNWLKPNYSLKDNGNVYQVEVNYDEKRDKIYVNTDKQKRIFGVSVHEDWDKTNGISSCRYYGSFTMSVPDDCDLDSIEKVYDKENKQMVITFSKVAKAVEDKTEDAKVNDSKEIDYKSAYEKLHEKYNREISELNNKTIGLRKENEELTKKLDDIKKMFN